METIKKRGFTCWTNFDVELGNAPDGCRIYSDLDELLEKVKCVDECGICEVEVAFVRMVQRGKMFDPDYPVKEDPDHE